MQKNAHILLAERPRRGRGQPQTPQTIWSFAMTETDPISPGYDIGSVFSPRLPRYTPQQSTRNTARKRSVVPSQHLHPGGLLGLRLFVVKIRGRRLAVQACLAVEEGSLFHGASSLLSGLSVCVGAVDGRGRGHVRDLLRVGVLAANLGDADIRGFASFGEGIVAAVKVLALLEGSR
jgi:hypothetical protein